MNGVAADDLLSRCAGVAGEGDVFHFQCRSDSSQKQSAPEEENRVLALEVMEPCLRDIGL